VRSPSTFEDILDHCLVAIQEQGKTVEECLARYPAEREALEPLLHLALRLESGRTLKAPPELRRTAAARMRNLIKTRPRPSERAVSTPRILDSVRQTLRTATATWRSLRPAAAVIGALIALLVLGSGGTIYALAAALPGDTLYAVKTTVEEARLAITPKNTSEANLHLSFATRRVGEAATLVAKERPRQDVDRALTDYQAQFESLLAFFGEDSNLSSDSQAALLDRMIEQQADHEKKLQAMRPHVSKTTRSIIERAIVNSHWVLYRACIKMGGENCQELQPSPTPALAPTSMPSPEPPAPTASPESPLPTPSPRSLSPLPSPASPIATPEPEKLTPTPSPQPPTPTPAPTLTASPTPTVWPPEWPPGWPTPPWWPDEWPDEWPSPDDWPDEWPSPDDWPDEWPSPDDWPSPDESSPEQPPSEPEIPDVPDLPKPPKLPKNRQSP